MVANIELEKKVTRFNCTVMMAHQAAKESQSRTHMLKLPIRMT